MFELTFSFIQWPSGVFGCLAKARVAARATVRAPASGKVVRRRERMMMWQ